MALLEDAEANLSPRMRRLLQSVWQEWRQLETDLDGADAEIERTASADASCQRLRKIPGVKPLASTASTIIQVRCPVSALTRRYGEISQTTPYPNAPPF